MLLDMQYLGVHSHFELTVCFCHREKLQTFIPVCIFRYNHGPLLTRKKNKFRDISALNYGFITTIKYHLFHQTRETTKKIKVNVFTITGQQKRCAFLVSLIFCQIQLPALSIIIASPMISVVWYAAVAAQSKEIQSRGILIIINLTAEISFLI